MNVKRYLWNNVIAVDQLMNTFLIGHPDETFSARCWRREQESHKRRWVLLRKIIDSIFFFQPEHCRLSYESEQAGNHGPKPKK